MQFETAEHMPAQLRQSPVFSTTLVELLEVDCFDWLRAREPSSIQAIVTDPPYSLTEFTDAHLEKRRNGKGGIWRLPPKLEDGYRRAPLPRFTVQTDEDLEALRVFFEQFAKLAYDVLVPGGHLVLSTNPLLATRVYSAILSAGFESRGEFIRLVTTLRGGDRPKGAEGEFRGVTVMPKSRYEPWGIFRKPVEGTVAANLRKWKTGGLAVRRRSLVRESLSGGAEACDASSPEAATSYAASRPISASTRRRDSP